MGSELNPKPAGYPGLCAYLTVRDAPAAIAFYREVFGAEEKMRLTAPNGMTGHAELCIAGTTLMLSEEFPGYTKTPEKLGGSPVTLYVYVPDVDATAARATELGAVIQRPPADQFYGDRTARIVDPFGHVWVIARHVEDVPFEELQRRFEAMCGGAAPG